MKRTALALFFVHALACLSLAQAPASGQWRFSKRNANGTYTDYGLTAVNGQAIGFTAGVPSMLSISGTPAWADITGKPTEFTPAAHTQAISTITGLQTALDDKASLTGSYSDPAWITGLAWSKLGSVPAAVTALGSAGIGTGVLTGDGSAFSYTATSTGGNTLGLDAGKIAVYGTSGELTVASALRLTAGPSVMGIWFNSGGSVPGRLTSDTSGFGSRLWTLPNVSGTLITTGDTGTVTSTMLAGSIALSKLAITGTPDGTKYLRDDGTWQTVTSGATLSANTFTGLQQFTGTDHAGLRLNNLTTTQRDALTGSAGMVIWNTTDGRMQLHNGTAWTSGMVRLSGDTMTGTLVLPAGSAAAPALTFGDSNTGIYRSGSGEIAFSTGGSLRYSISSAGGLLHTPTSSWMPFPTDGIFYMGGPIRARQSAGGTNTIRIDASNSTSTLQYIGWEVGGGLSASFYYDAAARIQLGADHATATTNQTLKAHDVTTGTGAALDLRGGNGSVAGGAVTLSTSATTTPAVRMTVKASGVINMSGMPTSSAGLSSGDLWNDGGTIKIVP